ncbi:transglycosylase SLT domain-containing protein [Luteimonas pelagia]
MHVLRLLCAALPCAPLLAATPADDARLRAAIADAERGRLDASTRAALAGHPAWGWVEYADLVRDMDALSPSRANAFLARHRDQAVAATFRARWLAELADRKDWSAYLAAWNDAIEDTALRCHALHARDVAGQADAAWVQAARALWADAGTSLPAACDPVFATLDARGALTPALRWQRLERAAAEGQAGVMRAAARGLPANERTLAEDYAAFIDAVHPRAASWPKDARSRLVASHGLARLAEKDPDRAEALLASLAAALGFGEAERGRVLHPVALWSAANNLPTAARRFAQVPASAFDARLREWQVREALSRRDWAGALAAIRAMAPAQRGDSKYQYFEGRLAELTGDAATARAKYAEAARRPEFHGFLAADRIDAPYALCPIEPPKDPALRARVAAVPALQRALSLYRIDRASWAVREWNDALSRFDAGQRQLAVALAQEHGWYDRAVFSLGKEDPAELRLYTLRFPLHHETLIRREARRNRLDPAFVAAEIRAESIFNPAARSPADARGLMQVLPSTGAAVARRIGEPWGGGESLYRPEVNIVLGTAYLRQMLDAHGPPYQAIAAYNAGPTPVARWKSERPWAEPDVWIETINYHETRDYVPRVLAFSVLYDWRLGGDALRLSDRLAGRFDGPRKGFACPA